MRDTILPLSSLTVIVEEGSNVVFQDGE